MKICKKSNSITDNDYKIYINETEVKRVTEYKYLGFIISDSLVDKLDVIRARNNFYSTFNLLLRKFFYLDCHSFLKIFDSHCTHMYGSELWINEFNCGRELNRFSIGYHKALKKVANVPYFFSNHHVCNSLNVLMFKHYINWILIRFAYRVVHCQNQLFTKLRYFFLHESMLIKRVSNICNSMYRIEDPFHNDIDAIRARIFYVQRHEAHSNAFGYLDNYV